MDRNEENVFVGQFNSKNELGLKGEPRIIQILNNLKSLNESYNMLSSDIQCKLNILMGESVKVLDMHKFPSDKVTKESIISDMEEQISLLFEHKKFLQNTLNDLNDII